MNILFIAPRYHTNLYYQIKALQSAGHKVFLFVIFSSNSECYDQLVPVMLKKSKLNFIFEKINKKFKHPMHHWPSFWDLKKKIDEVKPDILLVKNLHGGLALMSFILAHKYAHKIFVMLQTDRHLVENFPKKVIKFIFEKLFKIKHIVTPLKNSKKNNDPWFVYLPFIIETRDFEKKYFLNDKINILDIGKFQKIKDHVLLLRAFNCLKDKYNLSLTIIGEVVEDDTRKEIYDYIKNNNLEALVQVKENLEYKEVLNLYKNYDLFVLPCYRDVAAYSPVEAMANKLPAIVSDGCGTKCYIEDGKNGFVFKKQNSEDLIEKIEEIIKDKDNLKRMSEESFLRAKNEHSFELYLSIIQKIIEE